MRLVAKRYEELSKDELYEIIKVRLKVFVVEQNCIYNDADDLDKHCYHVFLEDEEGIQAYLRIIDKGYKFENVSIGRVLTIKRGAGLGRMVLEEGIKVAKEKMNAQIIEIEAQSYTKEFYEKLGFKQTSGEFLDVNIPHIKMELVC